MAYKRNFSIYERKDGVRIYFCRWQMAPELAKIALKSRLYVSGWSLSKVLTEIIARPLRSDAVVLIYEDGIPVCIAVLTDREYYRNNKSLLNVFCRKDKRRNGFGSLAIKYMRKHNPNRRMWPHGELRDGARSFYKHNDLRW